MSFSRPLDLLGNGLTTSLQIGNKLVAGVKNTASAGKQFVSSSFSSLLGRTTTSSSVTTSTEEKEIVTPSSYAQTSNFLGNTRLPYGTKLLGGALAFMSFIQEAAGSTMFAKNKFTGDTYQIDYNANDLPHMYSSLLDYCKAFTLSATSSKTFANTVTNSCTLNGLNNGPSVGISPEMGKQLLANFAQCFDGAMQNMCEIYHNRFSVNPATYNNDELGAIIVLCVLVVGVVGCTTAIRICSSNNAERYGRVDASAPPPSYDDVTNPTNGTFHPVSNNSFTSSSSAFASGSSSNNTSFGASIALSILSSGSRPTPSAPPSNNVVGTSWSNSEPTKGKVGTSWSKQ